MIIRKTLREQVVEILRHKILSGEIKPGERIIEAKVAEELKVSRGPLREALRQIEEEGLVVYEAQKGCVVKTMTYEEMQETYLIQSTLEKLAVQMCGGEISKEQGESESYQVPDSAPEFFMLNAANEYLCNEKIRQALSVAYDRQEMIDTLRNGKGVPIYSMMPDTIQVGEKTYTELVGGKNHFVQELQDEIKDPKALLIEGLKELGKDPDPSKVTIRYASRGTSEVSKKIAEWMKQQWESVLGINIEIDMMEWNIMWDKIDAGDYDIATGGWGPYYNEPSALLQLFDPDNGYFNAEKTGWSGEDPKKYQELLNEAKFEVDDQKKAELYLQAEELVVKSGLIEPTYVEEAPTFVKKYVKNYFVSTVGQVDFSKVYIEK